MRVGIAGLGKMGAAMAACLADRGGDVVAWNRSPGRVRDLGFDAAASPRALAQACPIVISSLFDAAALSDVYNGPDGLIAGGAEALFIEMSTVNPACQRALAAKAKDAGAAFIECPVSGTTGPARSGQLLGLVGGEKTDVERALPVLRLLCRRIIHVGAVGNGARTKLAVNLPLIAFWQSFGEAMAIMASLKMEPDWLIDLFGDTAGAPAVLKVKAQAISTALSGAGDVAPTFQIDAMRKDLELALREAAEIALPLPVAETVLRALDEAAADGWGERDCAWVPAYWAGKAGGFTSTRQAS